MHKNEFFKIQHPCMLKTQKLCAEEMYLKIIKSIYDEHTTNILNSQRLKAFL